MGEHGKFVYNVDLELYILAIPFLNSSPPPDIYTTH